MIIFITKVLLSIVSLVLDCAIMWFRYLAALLLWDKKYMAVGGYENTKMLWKDIAVEEVKLKKKSNDKV